MSYSHLTFVGATLLTAPGCSSFFVIPPFVAKSGIMPKKWQLRMLGDGNAESPHRDDIVM
jgi:hypothetical protein